jgi:hypothetical protein
MARAGAILLFLFLLLLILFLILIFILILLLCFSRRESVATDYRLPKKREALRGGCEGLGKGVR